MKTVTRLLVAGAGVVAAGMLAVAPAMAATAPAAAPHAASSFCTATQAGNTVSGGCTLYGLGATFTGTVGADGNASGTISLNGGIFGSENGTWTGGPFTGSGNATINYTVNTPAGPVSGSFPVSVS